MSGKGPCPEKELLLLNNRKTQFKRQARDLPNSTLNKICKCQRNIWKDAQHRMSLGDCKSKQEWHATTYLLEC